MTGMPGSTLLTALAQFTDETTARLIGYVDADDRLDTVTGQGESAAFLIRRRK